VDKLGAASAVVFLASLTYGLLEASSRGWTSPVVLAGLVVAAITGPLFIVVERRVKDPMLPLSVFKSHQFSAANAVTFVVYGALSGALFLVPVELQLVVRYTASGVRARPPADHGDNARLFPPAPGAWQHVSARGCKCRWAPLSPEQASCC